jgi:AmmeMemoRadiSam system protein B/AmmeMemoRadiSam system protein A
MKRLKNKVYRLSLIALYFLVVAVNCKSQNLQVDRQPAVTGQFYPADTSELNSALKNLFSKAVAPNNIKNVIAIMSPHAGYVYSGEVAASSFNQIDPGKKYDNIFIIGSSHHISFESASIYSQGNFITPLGSVKVNTELAKQLIKKYDIFSDRTDAHANEHSIEVQLPFLQYRMKKDFQIVPIVIGTQNSEMCKKIAEALRPFLNNKNLFIISTDFSHYPNYTDAVKVDKATADAIIVNSPKLLLKTLENNDMKGIPNLATSLCGWTSVLTLLYMTENNTNVEIKKIEYKNSGDSEFGDKNKVVGYNSIIFSLKEQKMGFNLNEQERKDLLSIARRTIDMYLNENKIPEIDADKLTSNIKTKCGAFVTLHKQGLLRGCIGHFEADEPLYKTVQQMAVAASTQDYRFTPVKPNEVKELGLEISVLTPMRKINSIDEIELGKHGIYIKKGSRGGTFLPQVATETGWTKDEFLGYCAQDKAGIGWDGWKDADIFIYEALVFSEKDFKK